MEQPLITESELSECDREALHLIGQIQGGAGHAIFFSYPTGTVVAADEEVYKLSWISEQDVSGKPVETMVERMLGTRLISWISESLQIAIFTAVDDMKKAGSRRTYHFFQPRNNETLFTLSLSTSEGDYSVIGMEIEEVSEDDHKESQHQSFVHMGRVVELMGEDSITQTCAICCDSVFRFVKGYNRGMVYRFCDDLSGEIIHEIKDEKLSSSYLGMRFPATDIPLPARQLYIHNGMRYIYNVETPGISIHSMKGTRGALDLTQCRMRAVAKPHVVYLRNMGVMASLSLPVVVNEKLWGLLAFHGYEQPFKPNLHQRLVCQTMASILSVRIEATVKKAQTSRTTSLGSCLRKWDSEQSVIRNLSCLAGEVLLIVEADVLVAKVDAFKDGDSEVLVVGDQSLKPAPEFWEKFVLHPNRELFQKSTRKSIEDMGLSETECQASGFVYFRQGNTEVMVGRGLRCKDVAWAGDPDEPKLRIGGILNPRRSFELYMEKARQESKDWTNDDLAVIGLLKEAVCEHTHLWTMSLLKADINEANCKHLDVMHRASENHQLFAHMSHELRTPFHGVMGCLSMLESRRHNMSDGEIDDIIATAKQSGNHMMKLLNDILDLAKDKYLGNHLTRAIENYRTLSSDSVEGLKSLAVEKGRLLTTDIKPNSGDFYIVTDRKKFIQIVSNILNNALKFTSTQIYGTFRLLDSLDQAILSWSNEACNYAGIVFTAKEGEMLTSINEVSLRSRSVGPQNEMTRCRWILVSVKDDGCGMRATDLAAMFEPYVQASSGSNRVSQGTGLGLFISVLLIYQFQGFIACSSTPNVGTVFHLAIPVEDGDGDRNLSIATTFAERTLSKEPPLPDFPIFVCGPIVVADDNKVNLKILHRSLTMELKIAGLDIAVVTAYGGEAAIELYKKLSPSLLIIDYHMPDVDGVIVTQFIRERESTLCVGNAAYIISYTADVTDSARSILFACGSDEIMTKPPQKGFIENLVKRLVVTMASKEE